MVRVDNTCGPAPPYANKPTVFSGFEFTLFWKINSVAVSWASYLVVMKSPFLIYSELSMAIMVASSTIFIHFGESLGVYLVWEVQLEGKKLLDVSFHHLKIANEVASYLRSFH